MFEEAEAETLSNNLAEGKTESLVDALAKIASRGEG